MSKSMHSNINGLIRLVGAITAGLSSVLFSPLAGAQSCGTLPCAFEASTTPLVNSVLVPANYSQPTPPDSNMISYRNEQHAWQTPDKLTHYLINVGSGAQQGLQIWTRFVDPNTQVVTWVAGPFIPNSGVNSTADGRLITSNGVNSLAIVYSTTINGSGGPLNGGNIGYMLLDYNVTPSSTTSPWTLDYTVSHSQTLQNVFTTPNGYYALNPTLAIDTTTAAVNWVAFTLTQCQNDSCPATSTIKLSYLAKVNSNANWVDTGLQFGPTDGNYTSVERSARLIATSNAVGMVYQVHQSYFWTYRINSSSATSAWSAPLPLFTSAPNEGVSDPGALYDNNPFASHYNAIPITDNPAYVPTSNDNRAKVYMVTVDHQRLLYFSYGSNQTGTWSNPQELGLPGDTLGASYPQIFFAPAMNSSNQQYLGALVNDETNGVLYQSVDNGQNFTLAANLNHTQIPSASVTFANPRFEVPTSILTQSVPVVQQYADQTFTPGTNFSNYLMYFNVSGLVN